MRQFSAIFLFLFFICAPASAEELTATVVNYGMIEAGPSIGSIAAPDSHTGAIFLMDAEEQPEFHTPASYVVAKLGVRFGLQVQVDGTFDGSVVNLTTRVTHPKFSDGATVDSWDSPMNIGYARFTGWLFESEEELVPGVWTFEVLDKERVLVRRQFKVELPKE